MNYRELKKRLGTSNSKKKILAIFLKMCPCDPTSKFQKLEIETDYRKVLGGLREKQQLPCRAEYRLTIKGITPAFLQCFLTNKAHVCFLKLFRWNVRFYFFFLFLFLINFQIFIAKHP